MKNIFLAFFCLTCVLEVSAQYPKLLIQLTDKGGNSFSLNNPSQFLSQRAIQRRTRYNIPIDSADLPVTWKYIDSIRLAGKVTILSTSKWLNQVLIATADQAAIDKINAFSFVKSARGIGNRVPVGNRSDKLEEETEPVGSGEARQSGTNGDTYNYGSNYNQVHIHEGEFLHNKGFRGENMQIAMLDAGFYHYKSITAFDSIRLNGQVLGERDFVDFDNSVNEDNTHGMQCLSILSANWPGRMVGTSPKANYWLLRTENAASEYPIEEHNWVAGAEFADSAGSDMISSSLGYYDFDDPSFNHSYTDFYKNTTMVSKGASVAAKKGMIVMNSAGNEGGNNWKYIAFPADADSVCTVGAVNSAGTIASFSSYGYTGKLKPNIVSVGASTVIAGTNNQPVTGNGTSYSNPNIAGLIACLWQAFPAMSNMKILDAVYKSADKYSTPDNRYGYGIPNFRTAYRLLKHDENIVLYGNAWLFAAPNPFVNQVDAKFIGRLDGAAKLELVNDMGQVVASKNFETEKEEVYDYTFSNLTNLPAGYYSLRYTDNTTSQSVPLQKGNVLEKDWLVALPNPFKDNFTVFLKAPETGEVSLRLMDTKGSIIEIIKMQVIQNTASTIRFKNITAAQFGTYFLQYIGRTHKRTIRVIK